MRAPAGVAVHGIGLTPGETAAFGFAGTRPVLLLPGRLDAALAVWLTLGRRLLHRLAGGRVFEDPVETLTLARKLASTVGLAELVPVRRSGDAVEPLACEISAVVRARPRRRLGPGAGRKRRLFRRRPGFGKALAMNETPKRAKGRGD